MSTDQTWPMVFAGLLDATRDTVKWIDALPADQVDKPLADLRDGLRAALKQYDKSKEKDLL